MPRLKVDPYFTELVIVLYENYRLTEGGSPTSRMIHSTLLSALGDQGPSERWVSGKISEYLELRKNVFDEPKIHPLGTGWPRDPKQVAYLAAVTKSRGKSPFQMTSLTASEIEVAIELQDILEWDLPWGKQDLPKRLDWWLPAAVGGGPEPGELAVIKEIATRRAIEQFSGVEVRYSDIYTLINFQPWRKWVATESATKARANELRTAYREEGRCNVHHLVRGFFVPPLMRVEISGTDSVIIMAEFLEETLGVTDRTGRLGQDLRDHFDKYYHPHSREEFEGNGMTLDDLAASETRDLTILQATYHSRSIESKRLVKSIDSLVTTRPNPVVIERDFGSTSIGYLTLLRKLIDDAWDDILSISWAPEDGPLVSGFCERPDFQSRSRPDLYFSVEVEDDLPF